MQKVVRTKTRGATYQSLLHSELTKALAEGYKVVMCNKIGDELEYIAERKGEND